VYQLQVTTGAGLKYFDIGAQTHEPTEDIRARKNISQVLHMRCGAECECYSEGAVALRKTSSVSSAPPKEVRAPLLFGGERIRALCALI
jgi:hypothetical protein